MKLRDCLADYETFLVRRHLAPVRSRRFVRYIHRDLFPEVGRRVVDVSSLRAGLDDVINGLRDELKLGEIYALHGFGRFLLDARPHDMDLGAITDRYLRGLHRRGVTPHTFNLHRRALHRLARHLAGQMSLIDLPVQAVVDAMTALRAVGKKDLTASLHHFADFLCTKGFSPRPAAPFKPASPRLDLLRQLIETADSARGFEGAIGHYLRELRLEQRLSTPHVLSVQTRLLCFAKAMKRARRKSPSVVTTEDIACWRDRELARGVQVVHDLSAIRGFFAFLKLNDQIRDDPAKGLRAKVKARQPRKPLGLEELRVLIQAPLRDLEVDPLDSTRPRPTCQQRVIAIRDHAILAVLAETGLRPAELRALTVDRVDLVHGRLRVQGKGTRNAPSRERIAYLESENTLRALRDYLSVRPVGPERAFFLNSRATPVKASALDVMVSRRALQAGLPGPVSPYTLRVSFASSLVDTGADPFTLRVLMGHDDIHTTFRLYTSLSLEQVRDIWRQTNPLAPPSASTPGGAA